MEYQETQLVAYGNVVNQINNIKTFVLVDTLRKKSRRKVNGIPEVQERQAANIDNKYTLKRLAKINGI